MTKSLILSAILDLVATLNRPMMPIWLHPDFKSGYLYLYLLISAKIFSIDAIARSSQVHAGLPQGIYNYVKYENCITCHSKAWANVKVFADKQMDKWTFQKLYAPQSIDAGA